ncbi:hypothetical protein H6G27_15135 [Nostoc linckia FACHB-104]|nr:hypothetical protein [Nostoc linckia FACHB-104]
MQLDSEEVLRSIEHHHGLVVARAKGIYSFSHLTFHEYFTAREFVVVRQSSEEALHNLVSHISEKRWQEVFLLAVGMSPNADRLLLLMKENIDQLIADDENLQKLLMWVRQKTVSVEVHYKPAAVRSFYLTIALDLVRDLTIDNDLACDIDNKFNRELPCELDNDLTIAIAIVITLDIPQIVPRARIIVFNRVLDRALDRLQNLALHPKLKQTILELKDQIPNRSNQEELFKWWERSKIWWQNQGKSWTEQLRSVMIKYHNIGHDWHLNEEQKKLLKQYYDANKLLIEYLNSDCYVSREVRQHIENTLILPITDIQNS